MRLRCLVLAWFIIFALASAKPALAQVQEALGVISFLRSLGGGGDNSEWIKLNFDAINLKLDQVLKNQESLQRSILLLSEQMEKMERSLIDEMRELPNREVRRKLTASQARVQTIARGLSRISSAPPELKAEYIRQIQHEIESIKGDVSGVMEDVIGISASYNKAKYSFISGVSSLSFDILMSMELTEEFMRREQGLKRDYANKAWYFLQYQSIVSAISRYVDQKSIEKSKIEIVSAFRKMEIPLTEDADTCFTYSGLYDVLKGGNPSKIVESILEENVVEVSCDYILGPVDSKCGGVDWVSEHSVNFYYGDKGFLEFDLEKFSSDSQSYLLVPVEDRDGTYFLEMVKISFNLDQSIGKATTRVATDKNGNSICAARQVVGVEELRSEEDRANVVYCAERQNCPVDLPSSGIRAWWEAYRDQTSLQLLGLETLDEAVLAMRRVMQHAEARLSVLVAK
ncbi:MAG: hypothetical protein E5X34_02870 [Mesorhizobium sp.]|uniref:hypothetical protein n=1 Tax=Mesorhizobium sp. TaxID=1871066 RepID=UPI0012011F39|nr:hypothetical protein [Mesorhizobium sp.]TIR26596.1 MAG: hypothetical protein E5X34_02870 [Mesorhizobium sp.]